MKEKIKEFAKSYLIGLILGIIVSGTIGVIAATYFPSNDVTYDNTESGLVSNDVQGAIDELYTECTSKPAGDQIIDNVDVVTSGDGLYEDEYEDGRYFYKGGNPNNYVTFNNEQAGWRIISIEPDKTIKIMKIASIGNIEWDTSGGTYGSNNWKRPADLNTYLNGTYYASLSSVAKKQIVASNFSIGKVTDNNNMSTQVIEENSTLWNGKIALPTVSEYIRTNSNKSSCGTYDLMEDNYISCASTGWMDNDEYWWTLTPSSGDSRRLFVVGSGGDVYFKSNANNTDMNVRPVVYLSSDIKITGGTGTSSDPYEISL